jgi:hypothetical protein
MAKLSSGATTQLNTIVKKGLIETNLALFLIMSRMKLSSVGLSLFFHGLFGRTFGFWQNLILRMAPNYRVHGE